MSPHAIRAGYVVAALGLTLLNVTARAGAPPDGGPTADTATLFTAATWKLTAAALDDALRAPADDPVAAEVVDTRCEELPCVSVLEFEGLAHAHPEGSEPHHPTTGDGGPGTASLAFQVLQQRGADVLRRHDEHGRQRTLVVDLAEGRLVMALAYVSAATPSVGPGHTDALTRRMQRLMTPYIEQYHHRRHGTTQPGVRVAPSPGPSRQPTQPTGSGGASVTLSIIVWSAVTFGVIVWFWWRRKRARPAGAGEEG